MPRRRRIPRLLARVLRSCAGVSAVEFALFAPVLVLGAFGTADAGRAIYEKMMISQALRAGAQLAMAGAEEDEIRTVLEQVASDNFTIAGDPAGVEGDAGALTIAVASYCACPGDAFVQLACTAICDSGLAATQFVRLTASKTFRGLMLPEFDISGAVEVVAE